MCVDFSYFNFQLNAQPQTFGSCLVSIIQFLILFNWIFFFSLFTSATWHYLFFNITHTPQLRLCASVHIRVTEEDVGGKESVIGRLITRRYFCVFTFKWRNSQKLWLDFLHFSETSVQVLWRFLFVRWWLSIYLRLHSLHSAVFSSSSSSLVGHIFMELNFRAFSVAFALASLQLTNFRCLDCGIKKNIRRGFNLFRFQFFWLAATSRLRRQKTVINNFEKYLPFALWISPEMHTQIGRGQTTNAERN